MHAVARDGTRMENIWKPGVPCAGKTCTDEDCCEMPKCPAKFDCAKDKDGKDWVNTVPQAGKTCKAAPCTKSECCGTATCGADFDCKSKQGTSPVGNIGKKCAAATCTADECCSAEKDQMCEATGKNCKGVKATVAVYADAECKSVVYEYILDGTCQPIKGAEICAKQSEKGGSCDGRNLMCLQYANQYAIGMVDKCEKGGKGTFQIYQDDKCTIPAPNVAGAAMAAGKMASTVYPFGAAPGTCDVDGVGMIVTCEGQSVSAGPTEGTKTDTEKAAAVPRAPSLLLVAATMAAAGMHAFM